MFKDTKNNLYSLGHKIFEFGDKSDFLKSLTTLCFDYIKNLYGDDSYNLIKFHFKAIKPGLSKSILKINNKKIEEKTIKIKGENK